MESTSKTQRRGKHNKSKFIWRFKPKSQNMQSITMTKKLAFQLKILIQNQTQSIKTSKSIDLERKNVLQSMWVYDHPPPTTPTANPSPPQDHEREPKPFNADPPLAHTMAPLQDHERERERVRTPMPIHTKFRTTTSRTMVSTQRPCEREERDEWLRGGRDKRVREKSETREYLD